MKSSFCIDLQRFMLIPTKFPLTPDFSLLQYNFQKYKIFVADLSQPKTKKRHNQLYYNLLCRY